MINRKTNKLPLPQKESLIRKVLDLLKQNFTTAMIEQDLSGEYTSEQIKGAISEADAILKTNHFTHSQDILILHTKRYQKEITRLLNTPGFPENRNPTEKQIFAAHNRKVKAYFRAIDTLGQLENVLNLTTPEGLSIEINNSVQVNLHQAEDNKPKFHVEALTTDEAIEGLHLLKKALVDDNKYNIKSITPASELLEDKKEVMLIENSVPNITGMKLTTPDPVIQPDENTSFDPVAKLKNSLRKIQAKRIQEAGGHLDEQEIEILNRN